MTRAAKVSWVLAAVASAAVAGTAHGEPAVRTSTSAAEDLLASELEAPDDVRGLLFGSQELSAEFHGFLNVEYYDFQRDSSQSVPSFDLHNYYLSAKARVGSLVSIYAEVEYEHGGQLKVDRAFIDLDLIEHLTFRLGRFNPALSYERTHYFAPIRPTGSRPLSIDIPFHEWSDTGVGVLARFDWIGLEVSVVNGPRALTEAGISWTDDRAIQAEKTFVGRVNVFPFAGLEAGIAGSHGTYGPGLSFDLLEVDARLQWRGLDIWAEFDRRWADDEPCSAATDAGCNPLYSADAGAKLGYYVLAAYSVVEEAPMIHYLKPLVRYDEIRVMDGRAGRAPIGTRRITVGLNWSPISHVVLKSEYQWRFEYGRPETHDDGLMLSAVADF